MGPVASSPTSVFLAELDAMVARAEAACERRRRAVESPRQGMSKYNLLAADLRTMERELARLREERDAYREKLEPRTNEDGYAPSSQQQGLANRP